MKGLNGEKKMKAVSELNGKLYETEDCCFFRNPLQSAHYRNWGCELVDLFVDGNMRWVWVFWKKDHDCFKERWGNKKNNNVND